MVDPVYFVHYHFRAAVQSHRAKHIFLHHLPDGGKESGGFVKLQIGRCIGLVESHIAEQNIFRFFDAFPAADSSPAASSAISEITSGPILFRSSIST